MNLFTKGFKYFLLLCCFLAGNLAFAKHTFKGIYVVNAATKIPVPDAYAHSEDLTFNALSDENGFISFKNLPATTSKLHITCIGFEPTLLELSSLAITPNAGVVYIKAKISSLSEVTVVSSGTNGVFKTLSNFDLHLRPTNNSQEILRMIPGLFIGQHAGGGKSEQIFLRGFDLDHGTDINLSVDGIPVNMVSHAHGQGYADLHWVIPELIDKINFNKGPYFADKGNFATAGFVAFKTKDYLEKNFVKTEGGQFETFRGVTGFNLVKPGSKQRNESLFFAGEASFTKGFFESPQNFTRYNAMLKYHGTLSAHTTLTAAATAFSSKWNASGQIPNRAVENGSIGFFGAIDNTEGGHTSRYNANIELHTNFQNGAVLINQLYYSKNKFELYSNFTFFKEDPVNGDQIRQRENRNIIGYNGAYQKHFSLGNLITQTMAGVQLRYDAVDAIELSRTKNRSTITKAIMLGDINEMNAGMYWSQKISLSKSLDVTGGVRADYFANKYHNKLIAAVAQSYSYIVSPKFNVNLRVNNKVQLYVYNGKGFHSNDTRVAVLQNGRKVLPPAWGSDVGGVFKVGKKMVIQSALWYLWLDQEFIYVGDEGIVEPGGQTTRMGMDVSIRYEVLQNLFADVDLSVANPRASGVAKGDSYLPLAPRFTSVGGITYRKLYGINGSIRYRYMGNRPANEVNSVVAIGYFITDATINYTAKKWEAGLAVQNALNTRWKETQFNTESRLQHEPLPISEIHFTPGTPFFAKLSLQILF